jgi:hypothetical protein
MATSTQELLAYDRSKMRLSCKRCIDKDGDMFDAGEKHYDRGASRAAGSLASCIAEGLTNQISIVVTISLGS